jgi:hypothetical protein
VKIPTYYLYLGTDRIFSHFRKVLPSPPHPSTTSAVSIFATTALVFFMPPISYGPVGTEPISNSVLFGNFCVMLFGEAVISDALVAYVSRSGVLSGVKVDLPVRACARVFVGSSFRLHTSPALEKLAHTTARNTSKLAWKARDKMATAALFVALALGPGPIITNAPTRLCFTSSERLVEGEGWVLGAFDDYMLSRCPPVFSDPSELYPNATAGRW